MSAHRRALWNTASVGEEPEPREFSRHRSPIQTARQKRKRLTNQNDQRPTRGTTSAAPNHHTSLRPSRRTACHALVGLLTSEPKSTGLLVYSGVFVNARGDNGHYRLVGFTCVLLSQCSVTAAGPSRNLTGVPLSVGRESHSRPTTNTRLTECSRAVRRCQTT